jgi:hypothetical protein
MLLAAALAIPGSVAFAADQAGAPRPVQAPAASPDSPPEVNQAQRLVFMNDGMRNVPVGGVLEYGFSSGGKNRESFTDRVLVKVSRVGEDGRRDMEFDFLTGERHLDFHPATAYRGNPISIHFLERDISELAKETGGDIAYFRNRVRRAFTHPDIRPAKVALDGKELDGVSVSVTPFVDDPNEGRFPAYANKRYDFLFSEQIPGGLYRIRTTVPDASGQGPAIEEDLTFRAKTPAG